MTGESLSVQSSSYVVCGLQTCDMNTFRSGVADRGASIRIPLPVQVDIARMLHLTSPSVVFVIRCARPVYAAQAAAWL